MSVQRVADNSGCIYEILGVKLEEDDEDFRSCCEDEDELKEREECSELDSDAVKLYFKGVSVGGDSPGSRVSGVGVVLEKPGEDSPIRVQKKLDFYVEESVADYLALLDGLSAAIQNDISSVSAFTDSEALHNQIIHEESIESPLLLALRERIVEQSTKLEKFVLKLVPSTNLQTASRLAQVAIGIVVSSPPDGPSTETCSICCEERLSSMMLSVKCSHRFCSHCMKTYVEGKVESAQLPIRCPQLNCKYRISSLECASFLPVNSLEKAIDVLGPDMICECSHEFCYSCGVEYTGGQQMCECPIWEDEDYSEELVTTYPAQQLEQWAWDSFESLPMMMDAYSEQERSQLALIQRFLAGGFGSLTDNQPEQSPPRCADSYDETMKDLRQLPWLERFVSVISDNYYEDYIQ